MNPFRILSCGLMTHLLGLVVVRRSWPSSVTAANYQSALSCEDAGRTKDYLLEQQLGGVRNRELSHLFGAFAIRAPPVVSHQATVFAGVNLEFVGGDHQPL